jgi:phosphatidylglycerophosphate synthase
LLRGFRIDVSQLGKAKMAVEVVAITALILGERSESLAAFGRATLWLALALAMFSGFQYFRGFWVQVGTPASARSPLRSTMGAAESSRVD